jgi:hypothetical protein
VPCETYAFYSIFRLKILFSLVQSSAQLIFRLYAKRLLHPDRLIGTYEMPIPVESRSGRSLYENFAHRTRSSISCCIDTPFVLSLSDGQAGESAQPVTLYLSINVSTLHPILPNNTTNVIEMSTAENTLHDADEATKAIDLTNTWEGAVARIQWLMDTLSPVAGVRHSGMSFYLMPDLAHFRSQLNPYAQMACSLLLAIPKVRRFVLLSEGNAANLDARHS